MSKNKKNSSFLLACISLSIRMKQNFEQEFSTKKIQSEKKNKIGYK